MAYPQPMPPGYSYHPASQHPGRFGTTGGGVPPGGTPNVSSSSSSKPPKICPVCQKVFWFRSQLVIHMRSHTGEKPYACRFCPYRTAQHNNLKTHENAVHRNQ